MLKPAMISRLSSAFLTSKMEGRELLPKDIWRPKGIIASGMDVGVYRPRIRELWGRDPLEVYACTEFGGIAIQPWGSHRLGLTFFPDSAYWEFLTESDYAAWRADSAYRPKTLLLNELQPGRYVLVGTSFNGGAFIRYVVGDLIKVVALSDEQAGIRLPQIVMESRADDIINLGSMIVLTERSLWEAMRCGKLTAMDWIARKEYDPKNRQPFIHLYVECDQIDCAQWTKTLHESLIATHEEYTSYSDIMRVNPWTVSSLAPGTFQGYLEEMTAEGADPGHLKPPRMQPPDHTVGRLLAINDRLSGKGSKG
jgi:hypothetical protein